MSDNPYKRLAEKLDSLPNGFPATEDGVELRLLAKLFTPEEARLAAELRLTLETPAQIGVRLGAAGFPYMEPEELQTLLKNMARKGLIAAGKTEGGLGFRLMPFVVGIYEAQAGRLDAELARLFEEYYRQAFNQMLSVRPQFHRVLPVDESVQMDMEIYPFESAAQIINRAQAWGVLDCICRVQKSLIGEPCQHPVDVCMILSNKPHVFDNHPVIRALDHEEALATLRRAAQAGLVHTVSNTQEEISYICNCCTCSCGILRGIAELGIANVIARSAFVNHVDMERCVLCEDCLELCQFGALSIQEDLLKVDELRCVGCGVCVTACAEEALRLIRRPQEEVLPIPATEREWNVQRATARGIDLSQII